MDRFRQFYTENRDRLHGYLLRRTGNFSTAADLVQETFARYLEKYRNIEQSPSLLYRIGRNLFLDQIRREGKTVPLEEQDVAIAGRSQEEDYILREQTKTMLASFSQLDNDDRRILIMVAVDDLTYDQIGKALGYSVANVKVRVHRARRKLRQLMLEHAHD
jgi:RNA polymerase sigma-70 factor (ECF subfamily)